jgi:flagellar protein FliO/FliZ
MDFGTIVLKIFTFFIFFGSILFLAYVSAKYLGKKTMKTMRGKYIRIVDIVALGFDKHLYLIQVGEQIVLMASSGKSFEYVTTIDPNLIKISSEHENSDNETNLDVKGLFAKYYDQFRLGITGKNGDGPKQEINNTENNRINKNVDKLKDIFKKDEDI